MRSMTHNNAVRSFPEPRTTEKSPRMPPQVPAAECVNGASIRGCGHDRPPARPDFRNREETFPIADAASAPYLGGMSATRLNPHDERAVAVRAGCDPRSVRAYLDGKPQRSTVAARIAEALQALGFGVKGGADGQCEDQRERTSASASAASRGRPFPS